MFSPFVFDELFLLLVLLILTTLVYSIFFGNKKLRHSLTPTAIGMKTAPLGCLTTILLAVICSCIFYCLPSGRPSWVSVLHVVAILIGLVMVCKMTFYFYRKAKERQEAHPEEYPPTPLENEINPRRGWGIFLFIVAGLAIPFLSIPLFRIWILPLCLTFWDLNYHAPIEIPLPLAVNSNTTIALTASPAGMLPHDLDFTLIVNDTREGEKKFKGFYSNPSGVAKIEIYYIPGKSGTDNNWLQFSQERISPTYFNWDTLKLETSQPDDIRGIPRQFIGIYTLGKLDTMPKDPVRE